MRFSNISQRSEQAARCCAIALGFSIPISVALDSVLLGLILVFWVASLDYRAKLETIRRNRIALAALFLFALLIAGLVYGTRAPGHGLHYLGKYLDLLFIPVFVTLFRNEQARRYAWHAFAAAMILTLVMSWLVWAGVVPHGDTIAVDPLYPAVFKRYLTQNVLMAFAALQFFCLARRAATPALRYTWLTLALLAVVNVAVLNTGRTGQIILALLLAYVLYSAWRWKGALLTATAVVVLIAAGGGTHRFGMAFAEWEAWQPGVATESSIGQRLEFYRNSLAIASANPLLGTGTGSFPKVYAGHVKDGTLAATENPHNEYLNISVQIGVIGLLALLFLFYSEWRLAALLPALFERPLAHGLVITFVVGCVFNSLLMDHTEGLFFAWASGVLFGGLAPRAQTMATLSP
jgi:O-antigen ligase